MDFYLDPRIHDIVLEDGDIKAVDGKEEIVQRVKVTLLAWAGEWLFDTAFGLPYREEIIVRDPNLEAIDARLRDIISNIEGIITILELFLSLDPISRILTVTSTLDTVEGRVSGLEIALGF